MTTHKTDWANGDNVPPSVLNAWATDLNQANTDIPTKQTSLTATAVKTSAYTAAVGDLIPADATSAGFTVTLPSAPADKARVVVKKIDATTNVVTVTAGGSDVFNKAGGSTSLTLQLQNQAIQLQYKVTGAIWYVVSTDVPLSGLDTRYQARDSQAITGLTAHLQDNLSATMLAVGDSTMSILAGTDNPWTTNFATSLGAFYDANVWWNNYLGSSESYPYPSVLRTSGGGERKTRLDGGFFTYQGDNITGDLEVVAKVTPPGSWALGSSSTLLSKWNTTGNQRSWTLSIDATGHLVLSWSTDGTSGNTKTATSAAALSAVFTSGSPGWIRASLDVDNGSSGYTVTFGWAGDGINFATLGSPVTVSGVTSVFASDATAPYRIDQFASTGSYSWVSVKSGTQFGTDVVPNLVDRWDGTNAAFTLLGGPLLLLLNAGFSGQAVPWADDSTRLPKVLCMPPDVVFTGFGINDAPTGFIDRYLTWVRHMKNLRPSVPIVVTTQNPQAIGGSWSSQYLVSNIAKKHASLARAFAAEAGVTVLDTYRAYTDLSTQLRTDGIHPSLAGAAVQGAWVLSQLIPRAS